MVLMTVAGASLGYAVGGFLHHSADNSIAVGLPVMVVLMAVGIINPSGVDTSAAPPPLLLRWLKWISPIKWAIEGACVGEFKGLELLPGKKRLRDLPKMGAFSMVRNGDQVLQQLGLEGVELSDVYKNLALLSVANLFVSWIGLEMTARRRGRILPKQRRLTKEEEDRSGPTDMVQQQYASGSNDESISVPTIRSIK
mmetsp:Transcript_23477/g.54549  ORF Transcript_23477/g.54549 Transcript_23477/m.54549 type:complete len:197 (-) Transcript_23477:1163-1753(-)